LIGEKPEMSDVDAAFFRAYVGLSDEEKKHLKKIAESLKEMIKK